MFRTSSATGPLPNVKTLDQLARQSGLIVRKSSRFQASGFLLSLIQAGISGKGSLNQLASSLGHFTPQKLSKQAIHQRINESSSAFLLSVIGHLIAQKSQPLFQTRASLPFRRFLVEDCTTLPMDQCHHECFPGNGNGKHSTAGAKVHFITDYLAGTVLHHALYPARTADQGLAHEVLPYAGKGDLIVRDRGFFSLSSLEAIEVQKSWWLSRLPASINAYDQNGTLLQDLLKKTKHHTLDLEITLGAKARFPCRLVASRLPKKTAEKNRRERKRASAKHGRTTSKQALILDDWRILITNLPKAEAGIEELQSWYELRWSIEIGFRGFKQSLPLTKALGYRRDHYQLEALLLAAMIYQLLTFKAYREAALKMGESCFIEISYEKLCSALAEHILRLTGRNREEVFEPDLRHIRHDRRARRTLRAISLQSLT